MPCSTPGCRYLVSLKNALFPLSLRAWTASHRLNVQKAGNDTLTPDTPGSEPLLPDVPAPSVVPLADQDLAAFRHLALHSLQGLLTVRTHRRAMTHNLVWRNHLHQRSSRMARLSSGLLATRFSLAVGLAPRAITRRWFAAALF